MTYNCFSTRAAEDLRKVTQLARRMVTEYGMSEKISHISLPTESNRRPYSNALMTSIDYEVRFLMYGTFPPFITSP